MQVEELEKEKKLLTQRHASENKKMTEEVSALKLQLRQAHDVRSNPTNSADCVGLLRAFGRAMNRHVEEVREVMEDKSLIARLNFQKALGPPNKGM